MTMALWEDTAPSFSREAYVLEPSVVVFVLPSVAYFILGVSVDAFKSSMTSIFMCPTTLGVLLFLSERTLGKLLSAMTRTEALRWLPRRIPRPDRLRKNSEGSTLSYSFLHYEIILKLFPKTSLAPL